MWERICVSIRYGSLPLGPQLNADRLKGSHRPHTHTRTHYIFPRGVMWQGSVGHGIISMQHIHEDVQTFTGGILSSNPFHISASCCDSFCAIDTHI